MGTTLTLAVAAGRRMFVAHAGDSRCYLYSGGTLRQLTADNAQGEYYLTDCPGVLKKAGRRVLAVNALKPCEALSINTPAELATVEIEMKRIGQ